MKYCDDCKQQPAQVTVKIVQGTTTTERAVCPACMPTYTQGLQVWPAPPPPPMLPLVGGPWGVPTSGHPLAGHPLPGHPQLGIAAHLPPGMVVPPGVPAVVVQPHAEVTACATCRYTIKQLQQSGKLGCPHCYQAFAPHIQLTLRRSQGGALSHSGKRPARQAGRQALERQIASLRARLEEAVRSERYEEAVVLRDQIRALVRAAEEVLAGRQEGTP